jgi:hypothetical protein
MVGSICVALYMVDAKLLSDVSPPRKLHDYELTYYIPVVALGE